MSLSQLLVAKVLIHDKKLTNIATSEATKHAPPMDSPNVQLHMGQFPLREIQKLAELLLHTKEKMPTQKWVGKAETCHKHHAQHSSTQQTDC